MLDLSARVFYKAHFDVVALYPEISVFEEVIYCISNWLHDKFGSEIRNWDWRQIRKHGFYRYSSGRVELHSTSFWAGDLLNWACRIDEYQPYEKKEDEGISMPTAPRIWTTEVGFEQKSADTATVSYIVYYKDKFEYVGLIAPEPAITTPRVIRTLIFNKKIRCLIGDEMLWTHGMRILPGQGKEFAERIQKADRLMPYILVVPMSFSEPLVFAVKPKKIIHNVLGNATVYYVEDADALDEINYYLPTDLRCYPGQIKIYWSYKSTLKFRFITASQIEELGEIEIIKILRRVFSTDINHYDSNELFRMGDCDELHNKKRIAELREKLVESKTINSEREKTNASLLQEISDYSELLDLSDEEIRTKDSTIASLRDEISDLKQESYKQQEKIGYMDQTYRTALSQNNALHSIRSIARIPKTPGDVGMFFKNVFGDRIVFTDRALRSLEECTTSTSLLWECFFEMATRLWDLYTSGSGDIFSEFSQASQFTASRGEGTTTHSNKNQMKQRIDIFDGEEIECETHMKKGTRDGDPNTLRVYYGYSSKKSLIVVSYCSGQHLENATTRHIK